LKHLEGDPLSVLYKSLGQGRGGAKITELEDGAVQLVYDILPIVRRSRVQSNKGGMFYGVMRNVHTDAETLQVSVDPFSITTGAIAPYPSLGAGGINDSLFDVWLIGATVRQISGSGDMTAALAVSLPSTMQGWGIDDSGVAVANSLQHGVAFWDNVVSQSAIIGLQGAAFPFAKIGLRIPKTTTLRFSSTSTLTSTYDCQVVLGIWPIGLGQDAAV